jgi:hypothetical protein
MCIENTQQLWSVAEKKNSWSAQVVASRPKSAQVVASRRKSAQVGHFQCLPKKPQKTFSEFCDRLAYCFNVGIYFRQFFKMTIFLVFMSARVNLRVEYL